MNWNRPDMTTKDVKEALRAGRFAWPGGYPMFFITSDGGSLCYPCVREEWSNICASIRSSCNDGWRVVARTVNWENGNLICEHCNKRIESAYAEPEPEPEEA